MESKISVVIPTYHRAHLIKRAIKSVLTQTYQNFEIIVVDDSQNDETEMVARGFNDKRIKYIHNRSKTNLSTARNRGVRESSADSKYIAFLDDDDEWLPQFLEKTIKVLEENNETIMATTYVRLMTQKGEILGKIYCNDRLEFWKQASIGSGCLLRKEIFTKENIWFDEKTRFDEDIDFGIRVLQNHKFKCIPEILRIYYRYPTVKGTSLSTTYNPDTPSEELNYFYRKNYQIYKKAGNEALAELNFITGKTFCRSGKIKEGRNYLAKAIQTFPRPLYFLYYLVALIYPKAFQNLSLIILKHKIFKGRI